ncbi:MAG: pyridoxamine 5'-phosphate oxidase family protein [Pseudonocardia sp.]
MGFHEGELAVQRRAGVREAADLLVDMLGSPELSGRPAEFLGESVFAVLTARDRDGRLWTSPLVGPPGFLEGERAKLRIGALPAVGDPLRDLPAGQPVGLISVDFARRRRVRVNGHLAAVGPDGMAVRVDQAYGNCPRFIHRRRLTPTTVSGGTAVPTPGTTRRTADLDSGQLAIIGRADTLFLGTAHPTGGADASHRGGPPGFVHAGRTEVCWPDYSGNNMFNSLGNLVIEGSAAVLFLDFPSTTALHVSGTAEVHWDAPVGEESDTGRLIRLRVRDVVSGTPLPLRVEDVVARSRARSAADPGN